MPTGRRMWAYVLAAVGCAGLLVSLWLPWYSFRIPPAAIDQAVALGRQFGSLGALIRQGAELARGLGALHLSAWQVLQQADVLIAIAAAAAGGLALLAVTGRARGAGRLIASAAGTGLLVAVYRTAVPPGPQGFLHPSWGAWLGLACGTIAVVAGLLVAGEEAGTDWTPTGVAQQCSPSGIVAQQPARATANSVPPPGP